MQKYFKSKDRSIELIKRGMQADDLEFSLTLLVTEECNLRCIYCFEPNKHPKSMSFDVAKNAIEKYLMQETGPENVSIDFSGGEPLLEFELIKQVVEYILSHNHWKKGFRFSIGTNGTIMTDEMKEWFLKHPCVQIGLSLDGTKEVHDHNRSGSYDAVAANIDFFKQYQQSVKMTISPFTIPRLSDSIIHIHNLGMKPEANVVFENIWGTPEEKLHLLEVYAKELDKLVDFYMRNPLLEVPRMLSHRVEMLGTEESYGLNEKFCGTGKYMAAVMPDGSEYPCHRFSPLGSSNPRTEIDPNQDIVGPQKCIECQIRKLCHSCLGANLDINGTINVRTDYHCEFEKLEVLASAKLMAKKLESLFADKSLMDELIRNKQYDDLLQIRNYARGVQWVQENVSLL